MFVLTSAIRLLAAARVEEVRLDYEATMKLLKHSASVADPNLLTAEHGSAGRQRDVTKLRTAD